MMKLATALFAFATLVTAFTIVVKAGCFTSHFSHHRRLSTYGYGEGEYERIAGYTPGIQVRDFVGLPSLSLSLLFVA